MVIPRKTHWKQKKCVLPLIWDVEKVFPRNIRSHFPQNSFMLPSIRTRKIFHVKTLCHLTTFCSILVINRYIATLVDNVATFRVIYRPLGRICLINFRASMTDMFLNFCLDFWIKWLWSVWNHEQLNLKNL